MSALSVVQTSASYQFDKRLAQKPRLNLVYETLIFKEQNSES